MGAGVADAGDVDEAARVTGGQELVLRRDGVVAEGGEPFVQVVVVDQGDSTSSFPRQAG